MKKHNFCQDTLEWIPFATYHRGKCFIPLLDLDAAASFRPDFERFWIQATLNHRNSWLIRQECAQQAVEPSRTVLERNQGQVRSVTWFKIPVIGWQEWPVPNKFGCRQARDKKWKRRTKYMSKQEFIDNLPATQEVALCSPWNHYDAKYHPDNDRDSNEPEREISHWKSAPLHRLTRIHRRHQLLQDALAGFEN